MEAIKTDGRWKTADARKMEDRFARRETGSLWENSVYIFSILYPVKGNLIPRLDCKTDPILAYFYAIVILVTLDFSNIKFAGKATHSWKLFEYESFYFLAINGRQIRQVPQK